MLMKNFQFSILFLSLILIMAPEPLLGQTDGNRDETPEASAATVPDSNCVDLETEDPVSTIASTVECDETKSLSNYKKAISVNVRQQKLYDAVNSRLSLDRGGQPLDKKPTLGGSGKVPNPSKTAKVISLPEKVLASLEKCTPLRSVALIFSILDV